MMSKLNGIIKRFFIGVGFGSFFLLAIQLTYMPVVDISRYEFAVVVLASGLIGLYSYLFDNENLSFLVAEFCHFILTLTTVLFISHILYHVISTEQYVITCSIFMVVYLLVWGVVMLFNNYEVKAVNQKLKNDREKGK